MQVSIGRRVSSSSSRAFRQAKSCYQVTEVAAKEVPALVALHAVVLVVSLPFGQKVLAAVELRRCASAASRLEPSRRQLLFVAKRNGRERGHIFRIKSLR